jgi:hypothetical protein
MFSNFLFENLAVYQIMSKNMVEPEGPQMMAHTRCMLGKQDYAQARTRIPTP